MTFDPRARAREMAIDLTKRCVKIEEQIDKSLFLTVDTFAFERALLAFAKEVLTPQHEKEAAVFHMTAKLCALPEDDHGRISRESAMELVVQWRMKWDAANRAKSLEDGA